MWQGSLVPVVVLLIVPFLAWIAHRVRRARVEAQRDVQLALLAKFASGEEMSRFLATEEGRRLVDQLATSGQDDPRRHAAGLLVPASILTTLSVGFGVLAAVMRGELGFVIAAVAVGSVGIGLFIAAALVRRMAKSMEMTRERS